MRLNRFVLPGLLLLSLIACTSAPRPRPEPDPVGPPAAAAITLAPRPVTPAVTARRDRPQELGRVTIAAVGDVLPHYSVKLSAEAANQKDGKGVSLNHDGYDALFADLAAELSAVDLAIANLETPVSPSGDKGNVEFHFNAPPSLLASLKASGFKLVSFANNHVYDQGRKGMIETLDELARAELGFFGAGRTRQEAAKGLRLEKNGVRLAFLGASQFFNQSQHHLEDPQQAHVNKSDDPAATLEAVKAARAEADFVIVSLHWGVEYQPKPRESEVDLAHALFEAGADVILGTHPHILQPLEIYQAQDGRTCLVVYSLGNFVSNQSRQYNHGVSPEKVGDTRDSALLKLSVVRRDYGAGGVRAELADLSFQPLWTENERVKSSGKEQPFIRIVGIERALTVARSELDTFVAALPAKPDKEQMAKVVRLKKRLGLLERRREIIEARLGTDFAAEHLP